MHGFYEERRKVDLFGLWNTDILFVIIYAPVPSGLPEDFLPGRIQITFKLLFLQEQGKRQGWQVTAGNERR